MNYQQNLSFEQGEQHLSFAVRLIAMAASFQVVFIQPDFQSSPSAVRALHI